MKYKTTVCTPVGTFEGSEIEYTDEEIRNWADLLLEGSISNLKLEVKNGAVFIPREVISMSVVKVEKV